MSGYNNATIPTFMEEVPERRERWAPLTEGKEIKVNGKPVKFESLEQKYENQVENPVQLRRQTEMMLQNHLVHISQKMNVDLTKMSFKQAMETVQSSNIAALQKYSLGIVSRLMPELIAKSLFPVQAMPLPSAPIFFLNHQYGDGKVPTVAGDRIDVLANRNETYAGGVFYDPVGTGDGVTTAFNLANAGTQTHEVYFDGVKQSPTPAHTIGVGTGPGGVDVFTFTAAPGAVAIIIAYRGYNEGDTPRRLNLELVSQLHEATGHALRGSFSVQAQQDMAAYHNRSLDAELSAALATELFSEIDALLILQAMEFASAGNVNFNSTGYLAGDTSTADRNAYDHTIHDRAAEAHDLIFNLRYREPTWGVGGSGAIRRLLSPVKGVLVDTAKDNQKQLSRRVAMGTQDGNRAIYKDPRLADNKILWGYKSSSQLEGGMFFAPYILFYETPLMPDPTGNFEFTKGVMTRAAIARVDMNFYSTLTVT